MSERVEYGHDLKMLEWELARFVAECAINDYPIYDDVMKVLGFVIKKRRAQEQVETKTPV